jgi:hypothetical protein
VHARRYNNAVENNRQYSYRPGESFQYLASNDVFTTAIIALIRKIQTIENFITLLTYGDEAGSPVITLKVIFARLLITGVTTVID